MNMYKSIKILAVVVLFVAAPLLLAAEASATAEQSAAVAEVAEKAAERVRRAQALDLSTVRTTWERCDVYVSRSRGNGKRVRVVKAWTCKDVVTNCGAVVKDGKVYASAGCYYAAKGKNQSLSLKDSRLIDSSGRSTSLLKKFSQKVKDFVVFYLK